MADRELILCPFHKETSPSCCVNKIHGTFRCFGCGAWGDISKYGELIYPKNEETEIASQDNV